MQVAQRVEELLGPIAAERKYCVVDVTYRREGGRFVLRVIMDKKGGITMDECAALSNELGGLVDRENIISDEYLLEVSSPGLDRKLKKGEDFVWAVGKKVRITTYAPFDGKNVFSGTLVGLGEGTVVVEEEGKSTQIPRDKIANARLAYSV